MKNKLKIIIPAMIAVVIGVIMVIVIPHLTENERTLNLLDSAGEQFATTDSSGYDGEYSAFCDVVNSQVAEILGDDAEGIYTVETTFDKRAFEACKKAFSQAELTETGFAATVTTVDGKILGVFSSGGEGVNYATEKTQPYSAFKPLSVYAPAFENGSVIWSSSFHDSPVKKIVDENGELSDWPANATGVYMNEDVWLDECIKQSLNTAAVKCLMQSGVAESVDFLSDSFGIDVSSEREQMSLKGEEEILHNIALGYLNAGVSPLDMAGFYQIFATGGKYAQPYSVLKITDEKGNVVYEHKEQAKQIISPETAFIMNQLLQNTLSKGGTAEKAQYEDLVIGGKTGTGSKYAGNWFVGYTPEYCCSVWHGQNRKNVCTEIFSDLMGGLAHDEAKEFPSCDNIVMKAYCEESGGMLTLNCNSMATGYFKSDCLLDKCKIH